MLNMLVIWLEYFLYFPRDSYCSQKIGERLVVFLIRLVSFWYFIELEHDFGSCITHWWLSIRIRSLVRFKISEKLLVGQWDMVFELAISYQRNHKYLQYWTYIIWHITYILPQILLWYLEYIWVPANI